MATTAKRKRHFPAFKAKVAFEAAKQTKTLVIALQAKSAARDGVEKDHSKSIPFSRSIF